MCKGHHGKGVVGRLLSHHEATWPWTCSRDFALSYCLGWANMRSCPREVLQFKCHDKHQCPVSIAPGSSLTLGKLRGLCVLQ